MKWILYCLVITMAVTSWADAREVENQKWVLVGDMYVPAENIEPDGVTSRGFKERKINLWDGGILRYQFSQSLTLSQQKDFLGYCKEMGEFADIQCLPKRAQDNDYVFVIKNNSGPCGSSYLGRIGGKQNLKVQCWRKRTIQHELMHALGISHEHNRMDRDDHITILWDNIKSTSKKSYKKVSLGRIGHMLNYYDFDSIMHYGSGSGAKFGRSAFYRSDLGPQAGAMTQTEEMSFGDHYILYALYGGKRP